MKLKVYYCPVSDKDIRIVSTPDAPLSAVNSCQVQSLGSIFTLVQLGKSYLKLRVRPDQQSNLFQILTMYVNKLHACEPPNSL